MKNMKKIIIYGVLVLLCLAAFGGYFVKNLKGKTASEPAQASTQEASKNPSESEEPKTTDASGNTDAQASKVEEKPAFIPLMPLKFENPKFKTEDEKKKHIEELLVKAAAAPDQNPVVGIARGEDYAKVTEEAINNAGGLKGIVKKGDIVLLKPNLCITSNDGAPTTTDYRTIQKIADMARECGASRVIVADGNFSSNAFDEIDQKLNKYNTLKGVEFYNFNDCDKEDSYELTPKKSLLGKGLYIPKIFMDADVVINVAKMKTHQIPDAVVSLSLKNSFGVPSAKLYFGAGSKSGLHILGMTEVILDLNKIRRPELNVIEGIVGGEGLGPTQNTPVQSNIILAGKDPVALDTVGLTFMGFDIENVQHVKRAGEEKIGIMDLNKIKINGADLNAIKMNFIRYGG